MGSRRVLGFALGEHHNAQLAYGALAMAVAVRDGQAPGPVTTHHGHLGPGGNAAILTRWGNHRGQLPASRCQPLPARARAPAGQAGGLIRLSGRIPPGRGHPINHLVAGAAPCAPRTQVRLAAHPTIPGRHGLVTPRQKGNAPHR
jgi:hypothetical protein